MKNLLHFTDHLIPYDTFLNDIASRVVRMLKLDADDPEFVSQRKAYPSTSAMSRWRVAIDVVMSGSLALMTCGVRMKRR